MQTNYLFLIPARGGSKGLPGKNLACVGGIPLVGRSARTARAACRQLPEADHRVVCSTDSDEIAACAREWGAEIPFRRPAELSSDTASTIDVVLHALEALGERFSGVVLLQPTSPLVCVDDIMGAIRLFEQTGAPVVAVSETAHPIEWSFRITPDNRLTTLAGGPSPDRRQDAQPTYQLTGAVYVAQPEQLRADRSFVTPATRALCMPAERATDVDTRADLVASDALATLEVCQPITIGRHRIGPGAPCFVIAEVGVNHNGDLELARQLVRAAAETGADAVKFQTFEPTALASPGAPKAAYQARRDAGTNRPAESQLAMLEALVLPPQAHRELKALCVELGLVFLSTPFDRGSADFLDELEVPAFKVGSGDLTDHLLLAHLATKGRPILLSTGMSTLAEVSAALDVIARHGNPPAALLHCVSSYPSAPAHCNLGAMATMAAAFGVPIGWSDHTLGVEVSIGAAALGACIIEKHLTLNRELPGPDHAASTEPTAFKAMVESIRRLESALGDGVKRPQPVEAEVAAVARKSLYLSREISAGTPLQADALISLRPATGISAARISEIIGRRARRDLERGTRLHEDDLE